LGWGRLCAAHPQQAWTHTALAESLFISPDEAHASVKRARIGGCEQLPGVACIGMKWFNA
jgi:hypothetical protein